MKQYNNKNSPFLTNTYEIEQTILLPNQNKSLKFLKISYFRWNNKYFIADFFLSQITYLKKQINQLFIEKKIVTWRFLIHRNIKSFVANRW